MSPDALDKLIITSLHANGRQTLPELAEDTSMDARHVLQRLHVLGGMRRVLSDKVGAFVMYWLPGDHQQEDVAPAKLPEAAAVKPAPENTTKLEPEAPPPQPRVTPEEVKEPEVESAPSTPVAAAMKPLKPVVTNRRQKPIVVRQEVHITQLSVDAQGDGTVFIVDTDRITEAAIGDPYTVVVRAEDITALIAALQQVSA